MIEKFIACTAGDILWNNYVKRNYSVHFGTIYH